MARATRSKPKAKEPTPEPPVSTVKALPASTSNPPKLFVLPKDASNDARIVTLENPANGAPSRYYFCPNKGFYEFTRIAAPKKECRSWLITGEQDEEDKTEEKEGRIGSGYVNKSADMFVATPIDLLFLILPALAPKSAKDTKQHFLALDEYLDKLSSSSRHWKALLSQHTSLHAMFEKRMRALCDTVEAGDETMYRISHDKLLALLLKKAERMVAHGLPPSMEEKLIKTALEVPIMSIKREESSLSGTSTDKESQSESQDSVDTAITTPDAAPKPAPIETEPEIQTQPTLSTPPEIPHLLRLHTSLLYLTNSYLPTHFHPLTTTHLASATFAPLTSHLSAIATLKSEAAALRSISDNVSRKRAMDDDEALAGREEKKRKKEEEEKRKKAEGRAVKMLKKVDTSGMKKMSSFFKKVEKKA
ncbi:ribonuclease H2 subunit B [Parastagonospora nodorum]|nr:ribonuclease H2 subunit B [Parastagonospora nodorum]KAH6088117.1 ribonuclease H2 subunit B [Parastagonospora nodorum]